ncbi:hypothetical protein AA313_de0208532 [Arthrobotrys entomopaga]|nr:hypothetical protein AA313_de0208532 [Arthrobotrys entomopaga]
MSTARRLTPQSICLFCRLSSRLSKSDNLHLRIRSHPSILRRPAKLLLATNRHYSTTSTDESRKSNISKASIPTVEAARIKWQDTLPENYLSAADQRLWDTLYGPPKRIWTPEETTRIETMMSEGELLLEEAIMVIDGVDNTGQTLEGRYIVENGVVTYHGPVDAEGRPVRAQDTAATTVVEGESVEGEVTAEAQQAMEEEVEEEVEEGVEEEEVDEGGEGEHNEYPIAQDPELPYSQRVLQAEYLAKALSDPTPPHRQGFMEEEDEEDYVRTHPMTLRGRFATSPTTAFYPKNLQEITSQLLQDTKFQHFKDRARRYNPPPLMSSGLRRSPEGYHPNLSPDNHRGDRLDAAVWLGVVLPEVYSVNLGVATEIRRRLGGEWARGVKKVLDVGGGGAGIIAWGDVVKAENMSREAERMGETTTPVGAATATRSDGEVVFENEKKEGWDWGHGVEEVKSESGDTEAVDEGYEFEATVVTGSPHVRNIASKILQNTTFLPRTPIFSAPPGVRWDSKKPDIDNHDVVAFAEGGSGEGKERKKRTYDLIFASYTMEHIKKEIIFQHHIDNLWQLLNPGGVLCLVELGNYSGFNSIANARQRILRKWIKSPLSEKRKKRFSEEHEEEAYDVTDFIEEDILGLNDLPPISNPKDPKERKLEDGMIIAPCTNHRECPMHTQKSTIFKSPDICRFYQRYQQSPIIRRVLDGKRSDHADSLYSYLAVRRGVAKNEKEGLAMPQVMRKNRDGSDGRKPRFFPVDLDKVEANYSVEEKRDYMFLQPRAILPPIKGDSHVTFDLCTSDGDLERWIVPSSFSKDAYRDARKASWGDLWMYGAKTKVLRETKESIKEREKVTREERGLKMRELKVRKTQVKAFREAGGDVGKRGHKRGKRMSSRNRGSGKKGRAPMTRFPRHGGDAEGDDGF